MTNQLLRLKPRAESYQRAVDLYRAAQFRDSLEALVYSQDCRASTLRARCFARLDKPLDAVAEIGRVDPNLPDQQRAEKLLLKITSLARLGREEEAEGFVSDAQVAAYSSGVPALEADFELTDAFIKLLRGDSRGAKASISRGLAVKGDEALWSSDGSKYIFSLANVHARCYDLNGFISRGKQGPQAQIPWVLKAMQRCEVDPHGDEWLNAHLASNLGALAREAADTSQTAVLRSKLSSVAWTSCLQSNRFDLLSSVAWLSALSGDHLTAFRDFRLAAECAPFDSWKLASVLDRAFLARELGQDIFAEDELRHAGEIADSIDWSANQDVFFPSLVRLAQLVASNNPAAARKLLERYRKVRANMPATVFAKVDPIWHGVELMAEADVARAEGRNQLAIDLYINAFEAFDKLGCRWRASLAAIELSELTDQPLFRGYAAAEAQRRPNSWIARRMATIVQKRSEPALA